MVSSHNKQLPDVQGGDGPNILPALREMLIQDPRIGRVEGQPDKSDCVDSKHAGHEYDETARKDFHPAPSITPEESSFELSPRQASLQREGVSKDRGSVATRLFHTIARGFVSIATIGIAFALLSYGDDEQRDLVRARDLSLNWLSAVRNSLSQGADVGVVAFPESLDQAPSQRISALPPEAPGIQPAPPPAVAGSSLELRRELEAMASDLSAVRYLLEQLAARQDQMGRDVAALQAAEEGFSQRLVSFQQTPTIHIRHKRR